MKKKIKKYLVCVLVNFLFCAILIGFRFCISYFPKLNQAWANATGGNPLPWKEVKEIIITKLPLYISCCFMCGSLLYVMVTNEEGNDDEKKN